MSLHNVPLSGTLSLLPEAAMLEATRRTHLQGQPKRFIAYKGVGLSIDKTRRAAIYCRVSTDDQSCDRQQRDLLAFAKRAGYEVVAIHKEVASGARHDRKERQKVIALAQARKIDAVLVTELTRWGRSTMDLLHTIETLAQWRVSVVAETGVNFDISTPQGKLILTLLAGLSQFERDLIAERTKSGLAAAVARGTKLGRPRGNRTDSKHSAAVITMLKAGLSYRDIAHRLHISKDTIGRIASTIK